MNESVVKNFNDAIRRVERARSDGNVTDKQFDAWKAEVESVRSLLENIPDEPTQAQRDAFSKAVEDLSATSRALDPATAVESDDTPPPASSTSDTPKPGPRPTPAVGTGSTPAPSPAPAASDDKFDQILNILMGEEGPVKKTQKHDKELFDEDGNSRMDSLEDRVSALEGNPSDAASNDDEAEAPTAPFASEQSHDTKHGRFATFKDKAKRLVTPNKDDSAAQTVVKIIMVFFAVGFLAWVLTAVIAWLFFKMGSTWSITRPAVMASFVFGFIAAAIFYVKSVKLKREATASATRTSRG